MSGGEGEEAKIDAAEQARLANSKGIDEYYDDNYEAKTLEDSKISKRNISFYAVLGNYSYKRYNVHFLSDDVIIYVTGNKY